MITGIRLKEKSKKFARIVRGAAQAHRLGILYILAYKPMEAHDIAENIDLPENLVSHHLAIMLASGWVTKIRIGRNMMYEVNPRIFRNLMKYFEGTPLARKVVFKDPLKEKYS